jgi:hypothetical protein
MNQESEKRSHLEMATTESGVSIEGDIIESPELHFGHP